MELINRTAKYLCNTHYGILKPTYIYDQSFRQLKPQMATTDKGEASDLIFPKEFDNADVLLISEVKLLLEFRKAQNENSEEELPLTTMKTLAYAQRFSKFSNRETINATRNMLMHKNLHKYELASIANLCPENADEAKSFIPSLENRIDDQSLQEVLDDIKTNRSFQY